MNSPRRLATYGLAAILAVGGTAARAQYGPPQGPPGDYHDHDRDHDRDDRAGWDAPPSEFQEAARQGFQDGIVGAQKDFENHRRFNVNNRDEYRHPNVSGGLRNDYRKGFRRGYDAGVSHYMGGGPERY